MNSRIKQVFFVAAVLLGLSVQADERASLDAQSQKLKEAFVDMARQVEGNRPASDGVVYLGTGRGLHIERVQLQLNGTVVVDERVSALSDQALTLGGYMPLATSNRLQPGGYQYQLYVEGRSTQGAEAKASLNGRWQLGEQRKPLVFILESTGGNSVSLVERSS